MESQFRLTVVLAFGICLTMEVGFSIPYILYQKLLCLILECTSPTLSAISNLSQEVVKTLWNLS